MDAPEIFGIIIRTVGLLIGLYGAWCFLFAINVWLGLATLSSTNEWKDYMSGGVTFLAVGTALMLGADSIARFAYSFG